MTPNVSPDVSNALPRRLGIVPIVEAVAEIRFSEAMPAAGQILGGALYEQLKQRFKRTEPLPISDIPPQIRRADSNLRYASVFRLIGPEMTVSVGDQTLAVSIVDRPYPGWETFRELIAEVLSKAAGSPFIGEIERASLKYVNLIEVPLGGDHLGLTNLSLEIGGRRITNEPTTLRTEENVEGLVRILQVASQATVSMPTKDPKYGLVIDLDVIHTGPIPDFWIRSREIFERLHDVEKAFFFQTLSQDTLMRHSPEY